MDVGVHAEHHSSRAQEEQRQAQATAAYTRAYRALAHHVLRAWSLVCRGASLPWCAFSPARQSCERNGQPDESVRSIQSWCVAGRSVTMTQC
jgi:hypothetical protein